MSVLPPGVFDTLGQVLQSLQTSDNAVRGAAEKQLDEQWTTPRPAITLMGMVEHMQRSEDSTVSFPSDSWKMRLTKCSSDPLQR